MDEPPSSSGDEPDEVTARVAEAFLAALRSGASQEQAGRLAAEAGIDMRITILAERMQEMEDAAVGRRRAGEARIARRWGTALDAYYLVTQAAADLGTLAAQPNPQATFDSTSKALILLQARACQTSFEVHALLAAGHPGGAYGRYRTLHELAVIAALISQYGRQPAHADLADRYLSHSHIDQYRQAQHRQRSGRELGWPALPAGTLRKLKREHDRLVNRYGHDYAGDYGWAAGLIEPPLRFTRLEAKADMSYLRYLYATGSHLIHASAHGTFLTLPGLGTATPLTLTGPSDTNLAQPAEASLNALIAVTGGLIAHGPLPDDLRLHLTFLALHELRIRTIRLLNQAEGKAHRQQGRVRPRSPEA